MACSPSYQLPNWLKRPILFDPGNAGFPKFPNSAGKPAFASPGTAFLHRSHHPIQHQGDFNHAHHHHQGRHANLLQGLGHRAADRVQDCIKAFSETDFTGDLKSITVPTLVLHGDDDQIVPLEDSGRLSTQLVKGAVLKVYPGAPHGMCSTEKDKVNADLLEFVRT
jgi:pimeloyl-ACP methyl ester carboxylesterase